MCGVTQRFFIIDRHISQFRHVYHSSLQFKCFAYTLLSGITVCSLRDDTSFCVPIFWSCCRIVVLVKRLSKCLLPCVLHAIVSVEDNAFDLALIYENITVAESWRTVVILSDLL